MNKSLLSLALLLPTMGAMAEQVTVNTFVTKSESFSSDGASYKYYNKAYRDIETLYGTNGKKFAETTYVLTPTKDANGNYTYGQDGMPLYSSKTSSAYDKSSYVYDEEGKLISYKEGYYTYKNTYDSEGRILTNASYSSGYLYFTITYSYNEDGRLELEERSNSGGVVSSNTFYDYDENGNMIEMSETKKGVNGDLYTFRRTNYTYNKNNQLISDDILLWDQVNNNGTITESQRSGGYTKYIYNEQGLLSERQEWRSDIMSGDVKMDHAYVYTYNDEGSVIKYEKCAGMTPASASESPYFFYDYPEYTYYYTVATLDLTKIITDYTLSPASATGTISVTVNTVLDGVEGYCVTVDGDLRDSIYTSTSFDVDGIGSGSHEMRIAPVINGLRGVFSDPKSFEMTVTLPTPTEFYVSSYEWVYSSWWNVGVSWKTPTNLPAGAVLNGYKVVYKNMATGRITNFASPLATATTFKTDLYDGKGKYVFGIYAIYNMGNSDTIFVDEIDLTDSNSFKCNNPYNNVKVDSKGNKTTYLYEGVSKSSYKLMSEITADQRIDYSYVYGDLDSTWVWSIANIGGKNTQKLTQVRTYGMDDKTYYYTDKYFNVQEDGSLVAAGYKQYTGLGYVSTGKSRFTNYVYDAAGNKTLKEEGFTSKNEREGVFELSTYAVKNGNETLVSYMTAVLDGNRTVSETTVYYDATGAATETITADYSFSNAYYNTRTPLNVTATFDATYVELKIKWDAPETTAGLTGYKIYENGVEVDNTFAASAKSYTMYNIQEGVNTIFIEPYYDGKPSCAAKIIYDVAIPTYVAPLKALKDSVEKTESFFFNAKISTPIVVTSASEIYGTAYAQDATDGIVLMVDEGVTMPASGSVLSNVKGGIAIYGMTATHTTPIFMINSYDVIKTDSIVEPIVIESLSDLNFSTMYAMLVRVNNVSFSNGVLAAYDSQLKQGENSVSVFGYFVEEDLTYDKTYDVIGHPTFLNSGWSYADAVEIESTNDIVITTGIKALTEAGMSIHGNMISAAGAKSVTIYSVSGAKLSEGTEAAMIPNNANVVIVKAEMANGRTVVTKYMR